ncbi:MAG TPA: ribose 5-phosphate isomerase B [Ruminococcaceae bacterium]|nr:ribose 5-phosphate isomerase B [Oscillospiraceae bacterium]
MIAIGCDHGGYELKCAVMNYLLNRKIEYVDCGCGGERCDYPDIAEAVCKKVTGGECDRAILICGTGIGMSMSANKIKGIRAAVCSDYYSAKYTRLHNNANVLCLGGRVLGQGLALELVEVFLDTEFEGGRHTDRIEKMMKLEEK